jgi:hypothetical protein
MSRIVEATDGRRIEHNIEFEPGFGITEGVNPSDHVLLSEDFLLKAGATLTLPWDKQDTSAAGAPVLDFVDNAVGGEYQLTFDATNEVQNLTLYWADKKTIDIFQGCIMEARVKVNFSDASGKFTANSRFVCGLASNRNATLDNIVTNAWFRVDGIDGILYVESDDGTTDNDDKTTGESFPDNGYRWLRIDARNLAAVDFWVKSGAAPTTPWRRVKTLSMAAIVASTPVQPFIEMQKNSADTDDMRVDYVKVWMKR